jgi:antitoxin HicB
MRAFPAALTPDPDGGFTVTFRDVPEAITEGDTREEALLRAEDALAMYIAAKEPLPSSSEAKGGEKMVPLSALGMAKTALYEAMREQGVGRAELARRLGWHLPKSIACSTHARFAYGACGDRSRRARPAADHRRCSSRVNLPGRAEQWGQVRQPKEIAAPCGDCSIAVCLSAQ